MTTSSLDLVRSLLKLLPVAGLDEIEVTEGPSRVRIRMQGPRQERSTRILSAQGAVPSAPQPAEDRGPVGQAAEVGKTFVKATMHGIFHRAPSPSSSPFVEVGAQVSSRQQLGILEAMKVFNSVLAPEAGVIVAIHADNGQEVSAGDLLFTLRLGGDAAA